MLTSKEIELLQLLQQRDYTYNELLYELKCGKERLNKYFNDIYLFGLTPHRKYYSDGRIKIISPQNGNMKLNKNVSSNETPIITFPHETMLKVLLISDIHLGCAAECVGVLDKVYDYAAKKGIHLIFGCGDLLDGEETNSAQKFRIGRGKNKNIFEQVDYFIRNYPYDKNILTFAVLGDHEKLSTEKNAIDIQRAINNARSDIIVGGYDDYKLLIRNEIIRLKHKKDKIVKPFSRIDIYGHGHYFESHFTSLQDNRLEKKMIINTPTLSNINSGGKCPSMLEMDLYFDKMYISRVYIEELGLLAAREGFEHIDELEYSFPKKDTDKPVMRNVEDYQPECTSKVLKKTMH